MAKYDNQIAELKNLLPNAKNILIALPAGADIDKFAAGLALFLSLIPQGKEVTVVSDDTVRVGQAHLFGVDHIQKNVPQTSGGNFLITIEGVAVPDPNDPRGGKVPSLEKLDYFVSGNNLDLEFRILPGQTFQPAKIVPHFQGSGFNLIFTIGAVTLNSLGNIYQQNSQSFSGVHIVNIDNQSANTSFGASNIVDSAASSLSEMIVDLISSLGLPFDGDSSSNLLAGIFDATENLSNQRVSADTYLAVAQCLRVGGRRPTVSGSPSTQPSSGLDLSALLPPQSQSAPSAEERPQQENLKSADSIEVEPGWLTPKVFKGTSAG